MYRAIIGAGGYSHDVLGLMWTVPRFVEDEYWKPNNEEIYKLSQFDPSNTEVAVIIANCSVRERIVKSLPKGTKFFTYIHPSAQVIGKVRIGEGTIVGAGSIIMPGAVIGEHVVINVGAVIGHDTEIGNFCTIAPQAGIMGDCIIGNRVEIGSNACVKEKTIIQNDVLIGMNAGVTKDITISGVYVGTPARRIK